MVISYVKLKTRKADNLKQNKLKSRRTSCVEKLPFLFLRETKYTLHKKKPNFFPQNLHMSKTYQLDITYVRYLGRALYMTSVNYDVTWVSV